MNATELYRAGKLREAIDAQIQEVKKSPGDQGRRVFLFELLAFAGELERAQKQIDAVRYDTPELEMAVQSYRKLLEAEQLRRRVFKEGIMPQFLGQPPEWMGKRLEALQALRGNQPAEAARLLAEADAASSPLKGTINNKPFTSLRDCDDLFGPVLEVFAHGDYYWLALEQVEALATSQPKFPRDLMWLPGRLEVRDGPRGEVFLPTIYPNSWEQPDDTLKLGRSTDWKESEGGPVRGVGLRILLAGDDAVSVLEMRELVVEGKDE